MTIAKYADLNKKHLTPTQKTTHHYVKIAKYMYSIICSRIVVFYVIASFFLFM